MKKIFYAVMLTFFVPGLAFGQLGQSYVFNSQSEVDLFNPTDLFINNLTIEGEGINWIGSIADKIDVVNGDIIINNTSITTTYDFFNKIEFYGSVTLSNNSVLNNPNGFMNTEKIWGDLVLDNLPAMPLFWPTDAFTNIDTVCGNFIVKDCPQLTDAGQGFKSLVYVGGDFEINSCGTTGNKLWDFKFMNPGLDYVGGDFRLLNNEFVNSLLGFEQISFIGGDAISIKDNG